MDSFKYAFFKGQITDIENAKVSIMANALQYGIGVFSGIRGYYDKDSNSLSLFRLDEHYKRFLSSIKLLDCKFPYTQEELININIEIAKENKPTCNSYFRPFAYIGHCKLAPNLAKVELDYALYMIPLEEYLPVNTGLSLMVSSWRRVSDNAIPSRGKFTGAYLNSALARKEAHDNGHDEAILLSEAGNVCEGSAENIFIVRDGCLITPCNSDDILEGVTRKTIIKLAEDLGIPVDIRTIDRSELYLADEVFLTGTGCQVAWVSKIDRRSVGNGTIGPITKQLQQEYFAIVRGQKAKYSAWCTKVAL